MTVPLKAIPAPGRRAPRAAPWLATAALVGVACADRGARDADPDPDGPPGALRCAPPEGAVTRELVDVARLRSEGTAAGVLAWPREDRDEIATIRDDDPATGWLPMAVGSASATFDLGAAGGPFALRALRLDWDGSPAAVEIVVRDACGGAVAARFPFTGAEVDLGDACGACVEVVVHDAGGARLVGASLTSGSTEAPTAGPLPPPPDRPATLPPFGVIEGFYGQPWSWAERTRLVDTLSRAGLGLYVYAPKDDPRHRARWREPYDDAFVQSFAELSAVGAARGAEVALATSPFIDFEPGPQDRAALVEKLRPFVRAGTRAVALFADDIEFESDRPIDGALGALHADEVNRALAALREDDPDLEMYFVGTVYSDARLAQWPGASAYLDALRDLDPDVTVLWTGSDTFAATLDAEGLSPVSALVGRPVGVWDNYWANDAGNGFYGRVLLAPLVARDADLLRAAPALVENLSVEGGVARLQASLLGAWFAAPRGSVDEHRAAAARLEGAHFAFSGDEGRAPERERLVARVLPLFESSGLTEPVGDLALARGLDALGAAVAAGGPLDPALVEDVLLRSAQAHTTRTELERSGLAIDLVDDLREPIDKVEVAGGLLLDALERIAVARATGDTSDLDLALADGTTAFAAVSRFRFLDAPVAAFVEASLSAPDGGGADLPTVGEEPPACVVGARFAWRPFDGARRLEVVGVDAPSVDGDEVSFVPQVAGPLAVVALALPDGPTASWSARRVTLVCRPAT